MATDDEVIRKRLLIEGESGADDRRINTLLKNFVKWCNTPGNTEESNTMYQKMSFMMSQIEFAMEKTYLIHEMNTKEMANYEQLYKEIEDEIEAAHTKIEDCKTELQESKQIRRHRQEYDALAKVIQKQPDRKQTTKKLEDLDRELGQQTKAKQILEQKLEVRRKQFHVLISAITELQRILTEDEHCRDQQDFEIDSTYTSSVEDSMDISGSDK